MCERLQSCANVIKCGLGTRRGSALTGEPLAVPVFLHVVGTLSHDGRTGISLVGTQSLPLLLETVLVPQVILHICLKQR